MWVLEHYELEISMKAIKCKKGEQKQRRRSQGGWGGWGGFSPPTFEEVTFYFVLVYVVIRENT